MHAAGKSNPVLMAIFLISIVGLARCNNTMIGCFSIYRTVKEIWWFRFRILHRVHITGISHFHFIAISSRRLLDLGDRRKVLIMQGMILYLPRPRPNIIAVVVLRSVMTISLRRTSSSHVFHVHCCLSAVKLADARRRRRVSPGFMYPSHFPMCSHLATSPTSGDEASSARHDEEKEAEDDREGNG